jgi:hypothetical protein
VENRKKRKRKNKKIISLKRSKKWTACFFGKDKKAPNVGAARARSNNFFFNEQREKIGEHDVTMKYYFNISVHRSLVQAITVFFFLENFF